MRASEHQSNRMSLLCEEKEELGEQNATLYTLNATLREENKALLEENRRLEKEMQDEKQVSRTLAAENQILKEKKQMWDKKNQELIKEIEQLKNEIKNMRSKEQFILPHLLKEKEEEEKNVSRQSELNSYEDLRIGNQISQEIVTGWIQKTQFVLNEYKQPESDNATNDEKCIELLRSKELRFQKMRQISDSSKSLFQKLNTQYNAIQSQSVQLNAKVEEISKTFVETQETYAKQLEKTHATYKICKEMFERYEQMVQLQNTLLLSKVKQQSRLQDFEQERVYVQDLEKQCKQWLDLSEDLYKKFIKELGKLESVLVREYNDLEKTWFKWSPETIVFFAQKCLGWWNVDKLELLKKMQMAMVEKEIDGNNIHQVGKDVLMNVLGLSMPAAIKMEEAFQYLCKKYPVQSIHTPQIPDKFLCPVSGKIMEDPVDVYVSDDIRKDPILASDQLTCDRFSIKRHLAEHPSSTSIHNKVRIIDNVGLAIEIHEFLRNHPELQKNITPRTSTLDTKIEGEDVDNETQEKEGYAQYK